MTQAKRAGVCCCPLIAPETQLMFTGGRTRNPLPMCPKICVAAAEDCPPAWSGVGGVAVRDRQVELAGLQPLLPGLGDCFSRKMPNSLADTPCKKDRLGPVWSGCGRDEGGPRNARTLAGTCAPEQLGPTHQHVRTHEVGEGGSQNAGWSDMWSDIILSCSCL